MQDHSVILDVKSQESLTARWREQTRLIATARDLFVRCIKWPEKQDEEFNSVLQDMEKWLDRLQDFCNHMQADLEELP